MGKLESFLAPLKRHYSSLSTNVRLVGWAAIISVILMLTGQTAPIEYMAIKYSSDLRATEATIDTVVVGIDDKTTDALGSFPIKRRYYAEMIDQLMKAGARRVFINFSFSTASDPEDDALLAEAMKRYPGKINVSASLNLNMTGSKDQEGGSLSRRDPLPLFRRNASVFDASIMRSDLGVVTELPFATVAKSDVQNVPSLSAKLWGGVIPAQRSYRVDFATRPESILTISGIDVIQRNYTRTMVQGKDIIIAPTSWSLGENVTYPGHLSLQPVIYTHIAGAETLKRGMPLDIGWFPFWSIALFCAYQLAKIRSAWLIFGGTLILTAAGFVSMLFLNGRLVFVDVGPAAVILLFTCGLSIRARQRAYFENKSYSNHISGLPNLAALQQLQGELRGNVVVTKIHNFTEILSVLNSDDERDLVEQIARRLSYATGSAPLHQGDEGIFAWVCDAEKPVVTADELDAMFILFRSPIRLKDRSVDLNLTFGVDADEGRSIGNRLASALTAADEAKKAGERWKFVNMVDRDDLEWRISLLGQLDDAIDKGEVWVAYQPKFDLRTNGISGAEALVRWRHPERGDIPPGDFIPLAESQGRIEKLTYFVLDEAVQRIKSVSTIAPSFCVSVNISPRLLAHPWLCGQILQILQEHNVCAAQLTLEITETAMLSGNKAVDDGLVALRDAGVNISIDDYGTGYSTLEYFRAIPATEIKIDRSFIALIEHSHSDRLMVHSTIQLAHAMSRNVVAEGVESVEQMDLLKEMGCDEVQGYFTGKPQKFNMLIDSYLPQEQKMVG